MTATKLLVPVDGSDHALRALDHAITLLKGQQAGSELHLVNVQPPVDSLVTTFVGKAEVKDFHREEGLMLLKPAVAKAEAAGIPAVVHIGVGGAGHVIAHFAKQCGATQVVMGARGLGGAAGLLLGSVSRDVIAESPVPVTIVK